MKKLCYLLALSSMMAGCAGMDAANTDDDGMEKVEFTGSMIPRKKPKEVEIVGKDGFQKALDDSIRANGMTR